MTATKCKATKAAEATKPNRVIRAKATAPNETRGETLAKLSADGVLPLAFTADRFGRGVAGEDLDLTAMHARMVETGVQASAGNLERMECLLSAQAQTLNLMFTELARRAAINMGEHLDATETYLRLALKAQAQSRATVEALSEMKNPRSVAFIRQANVAQQQQVNNGVAVTHARETGKLANELLRDERNEQITLDTRAPREGCASHSPMETVGAQHRPEDRRG